MNLNRRSILPLVPALGWVSILTGGCISTGGPEWMCHRCYTGPRRAVADVAVVLAPRYPYPLRLRAIDGERVREADEYHLLPGTHTLVLEPEGLSVDRGRLMKWSGERATIAPTLEQGNVYRLAADFAWGDRALPEGRTCERKWNEIGEPGRRYWYTYIPGRGRGNYLPTMVQEVWRHRQRGQWSARVEELGSFDALKGELARQLDRVRTGLQERSLGLADIPWPYPMWGWGIEPPKHWLSVDPKSTAQR